MSSPRTGARKSSEQLSGAIKELDQQRIADVQNERHSLEAKMMRLLEDRKLLCADITVLDPKFQQHEAEDQKKDDM